jgi:hypothetical protein
MLRNAAKCMLHILTEDLHKSPGADTMEAKFLLQFRVPPDAPARAAGGTSA